MATAAPRRARTSARKLAGLATALLLLVHGVPAAAQNEPITPRDQEYPLDVDLDDRVDPVRPGEDVVYEVEVENFTTQIAPDVVLTVHPPPGTIFVGARREPDWAEVPSQAVGDAIVLDLGGVHPCDHPGWPRCRDIWLTLRVDPGVAEGTVLENRVAIASADAPTYPPNEVTTYTTASSAAVRQAKVFVGHAPRDRAIVELDLARDGIPAGDDPPSPTIDLGDGVRVVLGEPGAEPILDVTVPAEQLRCTNPSQDPNRLTSCTVRDPKAFRPLGLQRLQLRTKPYLRVQRNNTQVRLRGFFLDIPESTGMELEVRLEAAGEVFADRFVVEPSPNGRFRRYGHHQGEP